MNSPLPATVDAPNAPPPLSQQQMFELDAARRGMKRIGRAIATAQLDGWTIAVFGGLTLLFGLLSVSGIVMGLGLGAIAWVELRAVQRLKRLDPPAARTLGYNQLALAGLLIAYAAWCLLSPTQLSQEVLARSPELRQLGFDIEQLERTINQLVYGGLIVVAIVAQGSLSLFYFRREKMVRDYLVQTPAWILQMQRAGMSP